MVTGNAKCPIFWGNFTPKISHYGLKNRALGFPGSVFLCITPKLSLFNVAAIERYKSSKHGLEKKHVCQNGDESFDG